MPEARDFNVIYNELKAIMEPYAPSLKVLKEAEDEYILITNHIMQNKQPLYFGMVKIGKAYVSFHLVPVYDNAELLNSMSESLKKRMQGKTCFNFKKMDAELFEELRQLTARGFQQYQAAGYVTA